MAYEFGKCGGDVTGSGPVQRLQVHNSGKFVATLGPSHAGRGLKEAPTGLQVALFTKPPAVEGGEFEEIAAEGYERKDARLVGFGPGLLAVGEEVHFAPLFNGHVVTHVGLVRGDVAYWYGPLTAVPGSSHHTAGATIFERYSVKVRTH